MNHPEHIPFLIAAYAVFAALMLWDFLAPRLRWTRVLREARERHARESKRGRA